jgi:YaiO family outer membrane protein
MSKQVYNNFKWVFIGFLSLIVISKLSAQVGLDENSEEYYTLARAAGSKGDFAKAANYCEKGLQKSPLDMDIKEYLGKCYMELGQLDRARMILIEVLKSSPRRVDARHYLINIETQKKRYYSAVCYANELLEITPYAKELWLKKVQLYTLMDNRVEANRTAKRLYQIFPEDINVKSLYNNILKDDALRLSKGGDLSTAADQYEKILEVSSTDVDAYLNLINSYIKMGNYPAALSVADRGLQAIPYNTSLLDKKIGLLDETQEYQKAMSVIEDRLRKEDSAHYREMLAYITDKAARFYKNADPYVLYGKVYERNPGNREAFDYLLGTAIQRGDYQAAEELLRKGLKSSPNSKELLAKQLYVFDAQNKLEKSGTTVEKLYALYPNDTDVREKYFSWIYEKAKTDFNDRSYKDALWGFLKVSETPEYGKYASQYLFAIYTAQKSFGNASKTIDSLISKYPGESQYVLNKVDLLMEMESFQPAYLLAKEQLEKHPDKPELKYIYASSSVNYIKHLNKTYDYPTAKTVADELLQKFPTNTDAFNYAVSARIAMKEYDQAVSLINNNPSALQAFDMKMKLAGVYSESGNHLESAKVLKDLSTQYPYNDSLRNNLVEEMLLHAKSLDDSTRFDQSVNVYNEVRQIDPKNVTAAIKLTNILIDRNQLDRSMQIVDSTLLYRKDFPDLLYQKGLIYEKMGNYALARENHAKFMRPTEKAAENKERLDYLEAKGLKNQVNISYLSATSDSTYFINTSVATLEYQRDINSRNTAIARVNYAARKTGVGVQGEADWYHTFKNKSSFLANVGVSNQYFPKFKAGLSFYQPFAKRWQLEIGARYARLQSDSNLVAGVLGLEHSFDKVWVNLKGLVLKDDNNNFYNTILAQARFYMRNDRNYITTMASVGTAPEDQRLYFQANTFTSYVNTMVGAGYNHFINPRTSFGIQGNWYNYKVSPVSFLNQYNLFLTLKTRF